MFETVDKSGLPDSAKWAYRSFSKAPLMFGEHSPFIACEQLGRRAFLMEIDPAYCDVIVQRWEGFTGKKAQRNSGKESPEKTPASAGVMGKVKT